MINNDHRLYFARNRLDNFISYTQKDYSFNWHHEVICDVVAQFVERKIKNLLITAPPRHGKSEIVSRKLPAWIFGRYPGKNILAASYSAALASRNCTAIQDNMESNAYRELFPKSCLRGSQMKKTQDTFRVPSGGEYFCSGVGGPSTGLPGPWHYLILDDPLKNDSEARSPTILEGQWSWFTSTFMSRRDPDGGICIIMTRWADQDIGGRVIEELGEEFTVVNLPALSEEESIGTEYDERTAIGEPLWPSKYDLKYLEQMKKVLGAMFDSLYQGKPIVRKEGALWDKKIIDHNRVTSHPALERSVIAIDPMGSVASLDAECGIVGAGKCGEHFYVFSDSSLHASPRGWATRAIEDYQQNMSDCIVAESNFGGDMVEETIRNIDPSAKVKLVNASRGKLVRAEPIAALYERGLIHHVGTFPLLEKEMIHYNGTGKSPNRLDALVWAITELSGKQKPPFVIV